MAINRNDDLILLLDDDEFTLSYGSEDDFVLVDSDPGGQHYTRFQGPYEAMPIFHDEQVFDTNDKVMSEDFTVYPINEEYILNRYGGITAIIG